MTPQGPILRIERLSVAFDAEPVLSDVTFTLSRGEAIAVVGPNGAGKTVLFRAILGLVPYRGNVRFSEGVRIGYVPQRLTVERDFPLTVEEFLRLRSGDLQKITAVLREIDTHHAAEHRGDPEHELRHLREHYLKQRLGVLSGGEFQKALIASALLNEPDVLLFDEPTSGLDVGGEESVYALLHRLQRERGLAILLISHDLSVVYRYAQQVLCLHHRQLCFGPPHEVLEPETLQKIYGYDLGFYAHDGEKKPRPIL
ncbi:MAG: metal ABC transporter ATP-binding protein [Candidatus Terrybacteria bacterium]|nr:metal ABC transporter ATP-binding protein [Candidatus Terrybacteria bacterium]